MTDITEHPTMEGTVYCAPWRNPDQVEFATLDYIDWFNNRRLHGEIGHVPPAEFEEVFYASRAEEEIKA